MEILWYRTSCCFCNDMVVYLCFSIYLYLHPSDLSSDWSKGSQGRELCQKVSFKVHNKIILKWFLLPSWSKCFLFNLSCFFFRESCYIIVTWDMSLQRWNITYIWVFNLNLLFDIWKETQDLWHYELYCIHKRTSLTLCLKVTYEMSGCYT